MKCQNRQFTKSISLLKFPVLQCVVTRSTSPPGKYWAPSCPAFIHWKSLILFQAAEKDGSVDRLLLQAFVGFTFKWNCWEGFSKSWPLNYNCFQSFFSTGQRPFWGKIEKKRIKLSSPHVRGGLQLSDISENPNNDRIGGDPPTHPPNPNKSLMLDVSVVLHIPGVHSRHWYIMLA